MKRKHRLSIVMAAALGVIIAGLGLSDPVHANGAGYRAPEGGSLQDLKAQVEELQRKIQELERKQAEAAAQAEAAQAKAAQAEAAASKAVTGGETKGSFKLPGLNTSVTIGGYIKGDVVFSSIKSLTSTSDQLLFNPDIPVGAQRDNRGDVVSLHARESRIFIKTETPTDFGPVSTYIEGDFFGSGGTQLVSNSYGFRLRHAFGTLGPLLVGQTWSTFMNVYARPITVDFGGPVGQIFIRQGQVRWTQPFASGGMKGSLQFALENPETSLGFLSDGKFTFLVPDDDRIPDLVGRVNLETGYGSYSLAVLGRELRIDNAIAKDSSWGGAVSLTGIIPTIGKDTLSFSLNYGNALGRYQYSVFPAAALDANGDIKKIDEWGGFVSYRRFWAPNVSSTLSYSYAEADNDVALVGGTANKRYQSVHANVIWTPVERVNLGLEYIYGDRELENGEDGDLSRVQFGAQYLF